jgi:hypothetical protein
MRFRFDSRSTFRRRQHNPSLADGGGGPERAPLEASASRIKLGVRLAAADSRRPSPSAQRVFYIHPSAGGNSILKPLTHAGGSQMFSRGGGVFALLAVVVVRRRI